MGVVVAGCGFSGWGVRWGFGGCGGGVWFLFVRCEGFGVRDGVGVGWGRRVGVGGRGIV